jgi:hypothetical protein
MPEEGVQFTKPAAKRIGDTVRSVEGRPFPPGGLQRRRSGGGSRSTLWEVISVETGTLTCTIQRVENQAGDLVAESEKADVLYDTDEQPAPGDRGLLIRLAEGSLFFFRRGAALERVFIESCAFVKLTDPTNTFGYPNGAEVRYMPISFGLTDQWIGIFKFKSVIPLVDPRPLSGRKIMLFPQFAPGGVGLNAGAWEIASGSGIGSGFDVQVTPVLINQDFDISTVTWNSYQALTKGGGMQLMYPFDDMIPIPGGNQVRAGSLNMGCMLGDSRQGPAFLDKMFTGATYAIALWITSGPATYGSVVKAGFYITRNDPKWTNGFLEWHTG